MLALSQKCERVITKIPSITEERLVSQNRRISYRTNLGLCVLDLGWIQPVAQILVINRMSNTCFICIKNNIFSSAMVSSITFRTSWLYDSEVRMDFPILLHFWADMASRILNAMRRSSKCIAVVRCRICSVELKTSPKTFLFAWEKIERTFIPVKSFHISWVVGRVWHQAYDPRSCTLSFGCHFDRLWKSARIPSRWYKLFVTLPYFVNGA